MASKNRMAKGRDQPDCNDGTSDDSNYEERAAPERQLSSDLRHAEVNKCTDR